ncbi:MAG: nicotinate phosphoribosyltransferase [Coriobacteriia bacterium]|nr:nicotinate phosphoribosyltransferase [Coriobacteriia bacterium]
MEHGVAPSAMLTDLYQLTMAQAYLSAGLADTEACFHLTFRENPFGGGFAVACGLEHVIELLREFRVAAEDIDYLASLNGADGQPLFRLHFLEWLAEMRFEGDVAAMPEGTVAFPREPLLRVSGPLPMCQLVETALLNRINFSTLVATKAARCRLAAGGDGLLEFGLRRAQGPDGGISASRAAYIGGCTATSNVAAGQRYGIPVAGTHAHSWVMAFDSEAEAFAAYADALPNNVTLLVDTYDTLAGVRNAVETGRSLVARGQRLLGVRIDSGDLAWLSRRAREMLDEAGLNDTKVVASNELDEHLIASLKDQGAAVDVWGVGTKLVTAWDQPALGGVYKLSAIRRPGEQRWVPRIKVSEQAAKVTTPGVHGVRRFRRVDGSLAGDMVYDIHHEPEGDAVMVDPSDATRRKSFSEALSCEDLLVPVFEGGRLVYDKPPLADVRQRAIDAVEELDPTIKRFLNPHAYPVGLERGLHDLRTALVLKARGIGVEESVPSPAALAEAEAAGWPDSRG